MIRHSLFALAAMLMTVSAFSGTVLIMTNENPGRIQVA
jgi:hypothetical protein